MQDQLNLISSPSGVDVYAKALGRENSRMLGQTPLSLPLASIEKEFKGSGPVYLIFEKEGYRREKVMVTELSNIQLNLSVQMVEVHKIQDEREFNTVIASILECQQLIKDKRYDEALRRLGEIERVAPHLSVVYEMQGAIFYLQKKFGEALHAYRLAVKYNPHSGEANKMRRYLESNAVGEED